VGNGASDPRNAKKIFAVHPERSGVGTNDQA
jgi:hypothetical protein